MRRQLFTRFGIVASVAVAAVGPAVAADRLGTDVVPTFQQVHLRVDADSVNYTGRVRADLDVRQPTPIVRLHADGQKLETVTLTQKGKPIAVTQQSGDRGLLTLTAGKPLAKGPATLEIRFVAAFNTQAVGLYRMVKEGNGYLFTQFEAEDGRKAFPCWDEPSFKFPYQLTLEVPERHQALCNTPIERESTKNGWRTVVFEKTPPMPSYLLALATGPLEFVPIPGMKVPSRVVTVKGQSHLAGLAVETTPPILAALEQYFGMPYPYAKLDLIAVPEYWFGAMENPGAITYADNILLLDPKTASASQRRNQIRITSHELAHMWFGDLVTMTWWDDLWLNESFADWMGDKLADRVAPQFKLLLDEMQNVQYIMAADARPSTDAIRQPIEYGDQAMRAVGVAYNKGKAVLNMFEHWMGEETFRRGVNDYLKANAWKNAVAADLWAALGKASGKDVTAAMAGYVDQQGLPLLVVEPAGDQGLRFTQKRFLNYGVKGDPLTWQVPVTFMWSDGSRTRSQQILLDSPSKTVALEGKPIWVMPNGEGRGYYRWSVPQPMMLSLASDAARVMNPGERIAFLGNLAALLDAGEVRGDLYLKILAEMGGDPEPLVCASVISGLAKAKESFVADDLREAFAAYVRRAVRPMADRFGLEQRPGEEQAVAVVRPLIFNWLGRDGRDPEVLTLADRLAEKHLADPASVDASLASYALRLHALRGDRALLQRYRAEFEGAKTPGLRQRYLQAMGHFDDPALQAEALKYVIEGPLRPTELNSIPAGVAQRSDAGHDRAFQWLRDNYDKITARIPPQFQAGLVNTANGCSRERLAIAKKFFTEPAHSVPGTDKELAQLTEEVEDCAGLREREGPAAAAYLKSVAGAGAKAGAASAR